MAFDPNALSCCLVDDLYQVLPSRCKSDGWPGMSHREAAALAQKSALLKKFILQGQIPATAHDAAISKFLVSNEKCRNWELRLESSLDELLWNTLKKVLQQFFYPEGEPLVLGLPQILSRGRSGPGASIGAYGSDFYTKHFSSPLCTTRQSLADAYVSYFAADPIWSDAEIKRQQVFGKPQVVPGNKLLTVPKNVDVARTICVEPAVNMFYQLGLGQILEERLHRFFGIDLANQQEMNRALAREGSVKGNYLTIDLSSASDLNSLSMLKEVLPRDVFTWFDLLRSPVCTLPSGETIELSMVSTMGNGSTFPLQTILFSAAVISVYLIAGVEPVINVHSIPGNFGVFGDDIIALTKVKSMLIRLLTLLGHEVNTEKSFFEGPFRESCGGDYYNGHDIRPVYLKQLDVLQDFNSAVNQLVLWSSKVGILLPKTISYLIHQGRKLVRKSKYWPNYVPPWENEDSGVRVPLSFWGTDPKLTRRGFLYVAYKPKARVILPVDYPPTIRVPKKEKSRIYNPSGLLLSVLHSSWRARGIAIRNGDRHYSLRRCVCPTWDKSITSLPPYIGRCSRQRWESVVGSLLGD